MVAAAPAVGESSLSRPEARSLRVGGHDLEAQRTLGTKDWLAALKVRKEAIAVARQEDVMADFGKIARADGD